MATDVHPKMLALSYYDGATSRFIDGLVDDQVYFFKVIAWNHDQDRRLFLLGQVDRATYSELLDLLLQTQPHVAGLTWKPTWVFENPEMEARANQLVEIGKHSLSKPDLLLFGENLVGNIEVVNLTPERLAKAIALASEDVPSDLADWGDKDV